MQTPDNKRMLARADMLFRERDRHLDKMRKIERELDELRGAYAQANNMWGYSLDMLRREATNG